MKKQTFVLVSICLLLGAGLIVALQMNSKDPYEKTNGFNRILFPDFLSNFRYRDIKYNSYYIAGLSNNKIFLGNSTAPAHMLITDYFLRDTLYTKLENPNNYKIAWKYGRIFVDFPDIYFYEKISPRILHSIYPSFQLTDNYDLDYTSFDKILPLSPESFALRKFDTLWSQNTLLVKDKNSLEPIKPRIPILKKQLDGWFCTDGMLLHSHKMDRLVYIYYYRNQFLCMDTNLNLDYTARTIDTISVANIKLDTIHSENRITYSAPRLIVNRKSYVSKDKLFVFSKLIADNENLKLFKNNSVIDVYDLKKVGKYQFSFYIPHYKKNEMKSFGIIDNKLVVIYDHYLSTFNLDFHGENYQSLPLNPANDI